MNGGLAKPAERPAKAPQESELIVGRLVDHGPAPYQHNPKEPLSYFVRIETERGDREIWGVDLERAFRQSLSTPGIGDDVGIRAVGERARDDTCKASCRRTGSSRRDRHASQSMERGAQGFSRSAP